MPTLLTTGRMHPALAARIEASVTGRRGVAARPALRRFVSWLRFAGIFAAAFAVYGGVKSRERSRQAVSQLRQELLAEAGSTAAGLPVRADDAARRLETWVTALAGGWEGDSVAHDLRGASALVDVLGRPAVYVRGPMDALQHHDTLVEAARTSAKDAFLLCLREPPPARTEGVLLEKVRVAYASGHEVEARTADVRRLNDAFVGLPYLSPAFAERVHKAERLDDLTKLRQELRRAPLERTRHALGAEVLLVVIDEPGDGSTPTELDGETKHAIRIGVVDLTRERILLRARRTVDPGVWSAKHRPVHARGLDGCALAFDLHASVGK